MIMQNPPQDRAQLQQAISALEAQRAVLGDGVVDASISALQRQLRDLDDQPRRQERKQITVLFADVSGFTNMSEGLDAEEVSNLMNTLWKRLDAVIVSYGGYIDKHIGDAVMALWGVDSVRESDPEMGIRAALAMQRALIDFRQQVRQDLNMRIGINTGPVLLGRVGANEEFTAMGDTVNTADRLEEVAPIGKILISHDTFQHVRGVFDVKPLEPIRVKGKSEALRVYIVKRAKPRSFRTRRRGVEGVETRMIGRGQEQRVLQEALRTVIEESQRQVITVVGEAGLGKSRLLYEFENWADLQSTDLLLLRGRARPENQQVPFGLFRDLFSFRFDIREDDGPQTVRKRIFEGLRSVMEPVHEPALTDEQLQMRADFIGHLLGYELESSPYLAAVLEDPKQIRDRAFTYLQEYFQDATSNDPVLVLIEDLHWADDSSLDMLADGAQLLEHVPLLVVATARPEFYEKRPNWFAERHFQIRLGLQPLSRRENRRLVYEILKLADNVPGELRDLIVENSEGNPYYVEELIKMLIEDGVIIKGEDSWSISVDNLDDLDVPPTLSGILQARLDSLTAEQKLILQQAAVIGRVFWDDALSFLNSHDPAALGPASVTAALHELQNRELIFFRQNSSFSNSSEFTFKHAILREVAYESVLLRLRKVFHGLTADWLRAQGGTRSSEIVMLTADHLIKAGRSTEAAADLHVAGGRAVSRFANDEAVTLFSRAISLLPDSDLSLRFQILRERELAYHQLGNRDAQHADLESLRSLAYSLGELAMAEVALRRAAYAEATSDYEAMIAAAEDTISFVSDDGPPVVVARAYLEWGIALERTGRYREAHEQLQRSLALAYEAEDRAIAALALRGLGIVNRATRHHDEAYSSYKQALAYFIELGDLNAQAGTLVWLGVLSTDLGDLAKARSYYVEALQLTRQTGFRYQESFALSNLGSNANYRGDYDRAVTFISEALGVARRIENRIVECLCLNNLGTVTLNRGEWGAALDYYEQSLEIALLTGHRAMEASALTGVGHAAMLLDDLESAIDALQSAVEVRRELDEVYLFESLAIMASAYARQGDNPRALATLGEVIDYLRADGRFYVMEYGLRNYLYVLDVLDDGSDPRAADILLRAHKEFEDESARIPDEPTRHAFRTNIPFHRELVARWKAHQV